MLIISILLLLCSCSATREYDDKENEPIEETDVIENEDETENTEEVTDKESIEEIVKKFSYKIRIGDENNIIYNYYQNAGYNYGPSIIKNEDGSYDAWFARLGNSGSQWDWICYRHSDDGLNWGDPVTVLKPTPGSRDSCSVCDPGVIYFNGYYYMAYTSTMDYQLNGFNNSAFVARSTSPTGPFEKWNGEGWGGDPQPFIEYTDDPKGWGIGEVSFVIKDDDLFIYYTYFDIYSGVVELMKADLVDDWPATVRYKGTVCSRSTHDSIDVAYSEESDTFFAVAIENTMSDGARLVLLESKDGKEFKQADYEIDDIERYAHNSGIAKTKEGHLESNDDILIGYAFGPNWGRWSTIMQKMRIETNVE